MKGTWTGAGLLAASLLALPLTARADDRDWRDDDRYRDGRYQDYRYDRYGGNGRNVTFGYGFDRGFQEGEKQGRNDARGRRAFDPARHGEWRDSDKGYKSSYGPRYQYSNGYRSGFERGYRSAFDQFYGRAGNRTKPAVPEWDAFTAVVLPPLLAAWRGELPPRQALQEAERAGNRQLAARLPAS